VRIAWAGVLLACVALTAVGSAASAQSGAPSAGSLTENLVAAGTPSQSYALYLPSGYSNGQRWPIVYAFDPGARGPVPARLMKDAAERYGYIIAASNTSRNNAPKVSAEAATAMWQDTHARLSIDNQRVYFAGFSGGARLASAIAQRCKCAQGVFLSGAGFSSDTPPAREMSVPVFMTAGMTDFNYGELVELDAELDRLGIPHLLRRFDGAHEWGPANLWLEALAWADLGAMKASVRPRDARIVTGELKTMTDVASRFEEAGQPYFAAQMYRAVAATFDGLTPTAALVEHAATLERDPAYASARKRERDDIQQQRSLQREIFAMIGGVGEQGDDQARRQHEALNAIRRLREHAAREEDPQRQLVLERARMGIFIAMIEAGNPLLDRKDLAMARVYFELAAEARPEIPWPHVSLARCLLRMGKNREALQALERATHAGLSSQDLANLEAQHGEFANLGADPAYRKLREEASRGVGPR
jgi:dienelactone hydrolase